MNDVNTWESKTLREAVRSWADYEDAERWVDRAYREYAAEAGLPTEPCEPSSPSVTEEVVGLAALCDLSRSIFEILSGLDPTEDEAGLSGLVPPLDLGLYCGANGLFPSGDRADSEGELATLARNHAFRPVVSALVKRCGREAVFASLVHAYEGEHGRTEGLQNGSSSILNERLDVDTQRAYDWFIDQAR